MGDDGVGRQGNGAEAGTRTRMGCPTRPSNVRVYQFHHFGMLGIIGRGKNGCQSTDPSVKSIIYIVIA